MAKGVKAVFTETSDSLVSLIVKEILSIVDCEKPKEKSPTSRLKTLAQYVFKIPNLLTDQAIVNEKFASVFEVYRKQLLPHLEGTDMSEEEKRDLVQINHFFCKMQLISYISIPSNCNYGAPTSVS